MSLLSSLVSKGSCAKVFSCYANYVSMVCLLRYLVREVVGVAKCFSIGVFWG